MISVCTAVHPPATKYLSELYCALLRQTYTDWEWVIACNHGATVPPALTADERVRMIMVQGGQATAKAAACSTSTGELIVRIDADDLITDDALQCASEVDGPFAYANFAVFEDCTWQGKWYRRDVGWQWRRFMFRGRRLWEHVQWAPGPLSCASLYMAPSCFLVWRRDAYEAVGGFCGEPEDSPEHGPVCRTFCKFGAEGMQHIDKCLYLYRQHEQNTSTRVLDRDSSLAVHQEEYHQQITPCYRRWCGDNDLFVVQLEDLWNRGAAEDDCIGLMFAKMDPPPFDEIYRVMAAGGMLVVDHKTDATDDRFQRYHHSDRGTHFVCLKPPYADRPVGMEPRVKPDRRIPVDKLPIAGSHATD